MPFPAIIGGLDRAKGRLPPKGFLVVLWGVSLKFALIPAGKFVMGSSQQEQEAERTARSAMWDQYEKEGPQHEVTISRPFYMAVVTVTQEQYQQVMGTNPSYSEESIQPGGNGLLDAGSRVLQEGVPTDGHDGSPAD